MFCCNNFDFYFGCQIKIFKSIETYKVNKILAPPLNLGFPYKVTSATKLFFAIH